MLGQTLKKLGCCGVLVWLTIAGVFSTFFIMEYLERPDSEKSVWKAGVTVSCQTIINNNFSKKTLIFQGIYCVGSVLGTGAGLTALIFLIANTIKDKIDDE